MGNYEVALTFYDRQLTIAREISDPHGEATALYNASLSLHRTGRLSRATEQATTALKIYEQAGDAIALQKVRETLDAWEISR